MKIIYMTQALQSIGRYSLAISVVLFSNSCKPVSTRSGSTHSASKSEAHIKESLSSASILVEPGDLVKAQTYYQRLSKKLSLPLVDANNVPLPEATLDKLIEYLGFTGLAASDLESLDSVTLMPKDEAKFAALAQQVRDSALFLANRKVEDFQDDKVLVSRFFAPKIVDYTKAPPYVPGWRKLVRLKPLSGSSADTAELKEAYILFNFVKADVKVDPFKGNTSKNNQVILVPKTYQKGVDDSAYFLVYLEAPQNKLGFALQGVAFDLPAQPEGEPQDYFVPNACAQCHGHDAKKGNESPFPSDGLFRVARTNYLDTDQWHDAMAFDFPNLAKEKWGVVFDGQDGIQPAMDVLRKLNKDIQAQNENVSPDDFKTQAAQKWIDLHAADDGPVSFEKRILGPDGGNGRWNPANAEEMELLGHLNHYCFRCHSSIRYNVFDKEGVSDATASFVDRLNAVPGSKRYMPQGRILPTADKDRIIKLTKDMFP